MSWNLELGKQAVLVAQILDDLMVLWSTCLHQILSKSVVWLKHAARNTEQLLPSAWPLTSKLATTREGGGLGPLIFRWSNGLMVYMSAPNFMKIGCVVKECGSKYGAVTT